MSIRTDLIQSKDISLGYRVEQGVCNLPSGSSDQHSQWFCLQHISLQ